MGQAGRPKNSFSLSELHALQFWRHVTQLITFIFLNGKLLGLASTGIVVPYLWAMGAPFSTVHSAYESLEYTIARGCFPLFILGLILFTAITVGRVFCGWACPFGMIQDFLSYLPFTKEKLTNQTVNKFRDLKWGIVGFSLFVCLVIGFRRESSSVQFPLGVFSDSPFAVLSPASTLFTYLPWMMLWNSNVLSTSGLIGWMKFGILIAVLVASIYVPRFFCRFICPMGALLEPFSSYKFLRIYRTGKSVEEFNNMLTEVCPMGVQVQDNSDTITHPGCINCGKCLIEFPTTTAQRFDIKS